MHTQVTFADFADKFHRMGRGEQFSYAGLIALFDYLEQYEQDTGEEMELDVIGLCCEFTEYATALEAAQAYGYAEAVDLEAHGSVDLDEVAELEEAQAIEWLEYETQVIPFDGGVIIANF